MGTKGDEMVSGVFSWPRIAIEGLRCITSITPIKPSRNWWGSDLAFFFQTIQPPGFDASSSMPWAVKWLHAREIRFEGIVSGEGR